MTGRARWRGKGPGTVDRKSLPGRLRHTFVSRLFVVGCPCAFPLGMGVSGPMSGRLRTGSPVGVCRARQRFVVRRFGRSECGTFGKGRPAQGKAVRRNGRPIVSIGFGGLLCGRLRAVWFHTDPARFAAPPFFGTKREERLPGVFPVSLRFRCTEPVGRWSGVCRGAGNAERRMGPKSCVGPTVGRQSKADTGGSYRSVPGRDSDGLSGREGEDPAGNPEAAGVGIAFRGMPFPLPEFAMG